MCGCFVAYANAIRDEIFFSYARDFTIEFFFHYFASCLPFLMQNYTKNTIPIKRIDINIFASLKPDMKGKNGQKVFFKLSNYQVKRRPRVAIHL